MCRYLWSNGPKECLEFPQYTFEQHYGKPITSYPPREVLFDYLKGRWNQAEIRKYIKFDAVVRDVVYNKATDDFTVYVKDLQKDTVLDGERFDYVIVASGHYSVPNIPTFAGIEKFPGPVLHAHMTLGRKLLQYISTFVNLKPKGKPMSLLESDFF